MVPHGIKTDPQFRNPKSGAIVAHNAEELTNGTADIFIPRDRTFVRE